MKLKNMIKTALTGALGLTALVQQSNADMIYKGTRGPTNFQLDERVSYGVKYTQPQETQTITENNVLKYWDGKELGIFGFVNLPVKYVDNGRTHSAGLGDLVAGIGPRTTINLGNAGSIHILTYAGCAFPTGDNNAKPALGTGRYDLKFGCFSTWLLKDKTLEADASFEYTHTDLTDTVKNLSDDLSAGFIFGGKISNNLRAGAGLTGTLKVGGKDDGAFTLGPRVAARYIFSPKMHLELGADYSVITERQPEGLNLTLMFRRNF